MTAALLLVASCRESEHTQPSYAIAVRNCTGLELLDVRVHLGEFTDIPGIIVPNSEKARWPVKEALASEVVVEFKQDGSVKKELRTSLKDKLPPDFADDEIVIEVCPNLVLEVRARRGVNSSVYPSGNWRGEEYQPCTCVGK